MEFASSLPAAAAARSPLPVTLLPAHPDEAEVSMQHYWMALERAAAQSDLPVSLESPFGPPEFPPVYRGRLRRSISRYLKYPLWVWRNVRSPVVHVLDHSSAHLIPWLPSGARSVVTVHDLIPLRDPAHLRPSQLRRFRRQMRHLRRVDHLVAVSDYTSGEIQELLQIDAAKITVVPNGVDVPSVAAAPGEEVRARAETTAGTQRILSVGTCYARKNLGILLEIFARLNLREQPVSLWRVGRPLPAPLREDLIRLLGAQNLVEFGMVDETSLDYLYREADALIFPSRLEGFGLPVLEALARGCPVVSSNASSLPEAGGEAALYFDPDEPEQAARHLEALQRDPGLRGPLSAAGKAHAKCFSWQRHFESLVKIYRQLASA